MILNTVIAMAEAHHPRTSQTAVETICLSNRLHFKGNYHEKNIVRIADGGNGFRMCKGWQPSHVIKS